MRVSLSVFCLVASVFLACVLNGHPVSAFHGMGSEPITFQTETRCGWFSNPTPANAWLIDKDGEWTIGVQGGHQADGDWPEFKPSQWIETNGHYGYGCACMKVDVNKEEMTVTNIRSDAAKPISACRRDKIIRNKEPKRQ